MKITYEGLNLTLVDDADYRYHSHINGLQVLDPNNWVHCTAKDESEFTYDVWYYIEDISAELEDTDWEHPSHVELRE